MTNCKAVDDTGTELVVVCDQYWGHLYHERRDRSAATTTITVRIHADGDVQGRQPLIYPVKVSFTLTVKYSQGIISDDFISAETHDVEYVFLAKEGDKEDDDDNDTWYE